MIADAVARGDNDPEMIQAMETIQRLKEQSSAAELPIDEQEEPIPEYLLAFPTETLQRIHDYFVRGCFSTTPLIAQGGVIGLSSVVAGRVFKTRQISTTSALPLCISAPSGVGKNAVKEMILRVLTECEMGELLGGGRFSSEPGIRNMLVKYPTRIMVIDEFGDKMELGLQLRRNANSHMAGGFSALKELYSETLMTSSPTEMAHNTSGRSENNASKPIEHPSLTIVGLTTNEKLLKVIDTDMLHGGTLNRFIFIRENSTVQNPNWDLVGAPIPDWLKSHMGKLSRLRTGSQSLRMRQEWNEAEAMAVAHETKPSYQLVNMDVDLVKNFYHEVEQIKTESGAAANLAQRWVENANRLALGLTILDNPDTRSIPQELHVWAFDFVKHHGNRFIRNYSNRAVEGFENLMNHTITKIIKLGGSQHPVSHAQLMSDRTLKNTPLKDRRLVIDTLLDNGEIERTKRSEKVGATYRILRLTRGVS